MNKKLKERTTRMTNDRATIKAYTNGLEPGELYIAGSEHKVVYSEKVKEGEKETIFDTNTYNFHLYPEYTEDNRKSMEKFCNDTCRLRRDIIQKIKEISTEPVEEVNEAGFKEAVTNNNILYIHGGGGRSGVLYPLRGSVYADNNLNHMFKYISVRKNGNTYHLNFMRFFVENKQVNCIFRQYQYDCMLRKRVRYPMTGKNESLEVWSKNIQKDNTDIEFYYNPEVEFDKSSAEEVAKSFLEFIDLCDKKFR